jgi:hypothetical protein
MWRTTNTTTITRSGSVLGGQRLNIVSLCLLYFVSAAVFAPENNKLTVQSTSVNFDVESNVQLHVHEVVSDLIGCPLRLWFDRACVAKMWDNGRHTNDQFFCCNLNSVYHYVVTAQCLHGLL